MRRGVGERAAKAVRHSGFRENRGNFVAQTPDPFPAHWGRCEPGIHSRCASPIPIASGDILYLCRLSPALPLNPPRCRSFLLLAEHPSASPACADLGAMAAPGESKRPAASGTGESLSPSLQPRGVVGAGGASARRATLNASVGGPAGGGARAGLLPAGDAETLSPEQRTRGIAGSGAGASPPQAHGPRPLQGGMSPAAMRRASAGSSGTASMPTAGAGAAATGPAKSSSGSGSPPPVMSRQLSGGSHASEDGSRSGPQRPSPHQAINATASGGAGGGVAGAHTPRGSQGTSNPGLVPAPATAPASSAAPSHASTGAGAGTAGADHSKPPRGPSAPAAPAAAAGVAAASAAPHSPGAGTPGSASSAPATAGAAAATAAAAAAAGAAAGTAASGESKSRPLKEVEAELAGLADDVARFRKAQAAQRSVPWLFDELLKIHGKAEVRGGLRGCGSALPALYVSCISF